MQARELASIADVDRAAWDRLFSAASEGFDYYRACELAAPGPFTFSALAVFDGDRLVAGAPLFRTGFRLDMMLKGPLRAAGDWLHRRTPALVEVPVVGAGSPHADELGLAFAPDLDQGGRAEALATLLDGLARSAADRRDAVTLLKNVTDADATWADAVLAAKGYSRAPALPIAKLAVPASEDAYIKGLSQNMRSNLRRRLKRASKVRVEIASSVEGVEDELFRLRALTHARASTDYDQFALISPRYFRSVMEHLGERARLLLYWRDDMLLGFALVLLQPGEIREKYNGMRYPEGPDNGIFYLNWMTQVRLCVERGLATMHAGETTYLIKARLGCKLHRSWIYYRHRRGLVNQAFRATSRWIAFDSSDPDLKELGAKAPYATQ